ncbi:MAG: NAD(P)/FAD-dependent oxidoreductase [Clostridia bacterium]|nr:NAD(P)/FAD-dependent oxidoreductase [Clostridia bacterium]
MTKCEVAIIGGGIIGSFVFNALALKGVSCVLIEKGNDVSLGSTKANSGIIHAGYDCKPNTLKAKLNVMGNKMYNKIAKRLGEKIVNCGSLVVGDKNSLDHLTLLLNQGKQNGVKNIKILNKKQIKKLEPNLSDNIEYALYAKSAKLVAPYHFCISLCEEAVINGGKLLLNFDVKKITKNDEGYTLHGQQNEFVCCKYLINATAQNVNVINKMLDDKILDLELIKGEYILLDHSEKGLVNRPIFPLPTKLGKGILACPTVKGNVFFGPTAVPINTYDTSVDYQSLDVIKSQVGNMVNNINYKKTIKLYAGVRVKCGDDFVINQSSTNKNYFVLAGINSPGLSAAPAIAQHILQLLQQNGLKTKKIKPKKRKPYTNILTLSQGKLNRLIKKDANYGEIVCRCEMISKGEILEVLSSPIPPITTDGIKRRLRTTMGRCQGSFCYPKLLEICAKHYNCDSNKINFKADSSVVTNDIKVGGIYEK